MKIDYSTNINFYKLIDIDNSNNYIFDLSKEAITSLTNIFRNYASIGIQIRTNYKGYFFSIY